VTDVVSVDAVSGEVIGLVAAESSHSDVVRVCAAAAAASHAWARRSRAERSHLLQAVAAGLAAAADEIVAMARRETALHEVRLRGELVRTAYQLQLFAEAVDEGSYLEATIDHAAGTPMGPRPDLRRMMVPLGPVAVFAASNFPLAFSVLGGDTAAALAAGCAVVVKVHPSHPATSELCHGVLRRAVDEVGAPADLVQLVHGLEAGRALVVQPQVRAVGFTGSLRGGRALHDLAASRPDPIPFYGELGSVNPLVVLPGACAERPQEIADGLVVSFTLGAGQFCTKPGLIFLPEGAAGDRVRDAMGDAVAAQPSSVLLDDGIRTGFLGGAGRMSEHPAVRAVAGGTEGESGREVRAVLLEVSAEELTDALTDECFGPLALLVRYSSAEDLLRGLRLVPASLTATIHQGDGDLELAARLEDELRERAGRLIWNGYPTGVAVSWAMQHGGPWPATTSIHTSVGQTSMRRFLRPVTWQSAPAELLPQELREAEPGFPGIPCRVDGRLVLPAPAPQPVEGQVG
jgi:NADP-dependent aldehyde dehydrogenase